MGSTSRMIVLTLPGSADPALAIAASRAGAIGVLDLEYVTDPVTIEHSMAELAQLGNGDRGVKLDHSDGKRIQEILARLPEGIALVVLARPQLTRLADDVQTLHGRGKRVLVEAIDPATAAVAAAAQVDGVILKGNEAGGRIGEETAFVLFQHCARHISVPMWVQGGIGLHTAAACVAGGATGYVLDWQL